MRSHVGLALLADGDDPARELRRALRGRPGIVVVDGLDAIDDAARDQVAAVLRDASAARGTKPLTLVATAQSPDRALALLAEARRADIHSLPLRAALRSSSTTDVTSS